MALEKHCQFFDSLLSDYRGAASTTSVLEVGCGPGHFLYWAKSRGFKSARGFDLSAEQIACAKSLGLDAEVASLSDYMTANEAKYDLVVAMDLIEHLMRDEVFEFLDLCLQAVRPGGNLFLTTPNGAGIRPGPIIYGDLTHETIFSPQTITLALQLAGFEKILVKEILPPVRSIKSAIRRILWSVMRLRPLLLDLVEKGSLPTRVFSRVMSVQASKPATSSMPEQPNH